MDNIDSKWRTYIYVSRSEFSGSSVYIYIKFINIKILQLYRYTVFMPLGNHQTIDYIQLLSCFYSLLLDDIMALLSLNSL